MNGIEVGEDIRCYQSRDLTWTVDDRTFEHKICRIQTKDKAIEVVSRVKKKGWEHGRDRTL
jgi:hypothetical protein